MEKNFGTDMTVGSIPRHLLSFSIPMLIGNLINVGYNIVNAIWVGNIVGNDAIGATAVSFPIIFILIGLASGVTMATTILVAQYYGAKDYTMVEKVVNNSFSISIILGLFLTLAGIMSSDFILKLMGTPEEIFDLASSYLKLSLAGFVFMYLGFLVAAILRGIGDTKTPLAFMAIGFALNGILDPLLIIGVGPLPKLGLNGAAIASLIAQTTAFIIAMVYMNRKNHFVAFDPRKLALDRHITFMLFKIGLPSMVQQSLVSIGSAFITSFVNAFGAQAINAFGAVSRVDSIAFMPSMSLSMAVSALTGQNLGANKPERVTEVFKWGVVMTSVITLAISAVAVLMPGIILSGFGLKGYDLEIGVTYLRIVGSSYILFAIMFISNGVINGAGHTITTMLFSLLSLWIVRVPLAAILSRTGMGLTGIWISIVISFGIVMLISLAYYKTGRWKKAIIKRNVQSPIPDAE